jgi:hypothetical protein
MAHNEMATLLAEQPALSMLQFTVTHHEKLFGPPVPSATSPAGIRPRAADQVGIQSIYLKFEIFADGTGCVPAISPAARPVDPAQRRRVLDTLRMLRTMMRMIPGLPSQTDIVRRALQTKPVTALSSPPAVAATTRAALTTPKSVPHSDSATTRDAMETLYRELGSFGM